MAATIEAAFSDTKVELVPGSKGDFIVTRDGKELWNKKAMDGQFPEERVIVEKLRGT